MNRKNGLWLLAMGVVLLVCEIPSAQATIDGITGTAFNFTAKPGII